MKEVSQQPSNVATYRPGDVVLFLADSTSGEAMVIGHDARNENVLVVAVGAECREMDVAECFPTAQINRPLEKVSASAP